jgi:hypothetical protein
VFKIAKFQIIYLFTPPPSISSQLSLPIAGDDIGPVDIVEMWKAELLDCFADVMVAPNHDQFRAILDLLRQVKNWVLWYKVHILHHCKLILLLCLVHHYIDAATVAWCLEA